MQTYLRFILLLLFYAACADDPESDNIDITLGPAVDIWLNVAPAGAPIDDTNRISLAAFQDGDGEWTLMDGGNGTYTATVRHDTFGVAFACTRTNPFRPLETIGRVHYRTISEETVINDFSCYSAQNNYDTVSITVTGTQGDEDTQVAYRGNFYSVMYSQFNLHTSSNSNTIWGVKKYNNPMMSIASVARLADLSFPRPSTLSIDLSSAIEPVIERLEVSAPQGSQYQSSTEIRNVDGLSLLLPAAGSSYVAPAASQLRSSDIICVSTSGSTFGRDDFTILTCIGSPMPLSIKTPRAFNAVGPVQATLGEKRFPNFSVSRERSIYPIVDYEFESRISDPFPLTLVIHASHSWLNREDTKCVFPDLSALPGYLPMLEFPIGAEMQWHATRIEQSTRQLVPGHVMKASSSRGVLLLK